MTRSAFTIFAISGLLAVSGCSESPSNEPKKLEQLVNDEPAEPLRPEEPNFPSPTLSENPPIEQATFQDAADVGSNSPAKVPQVLLTKEHQTLCKVKVGETLPPIELPKVLGGTAQLSALYGKAATVVVFWKGDRQMAVDELADLGPDVVQKFGSRGVDVVGIAVSEGAADARSTIQKTAANFPHLLDADGNAFEKVGSERLPWTLVLDANGKIVWFDLEYSLATRRELQQALLALVR